MAVGYLADETDQAVVIPFRDIQLSRIGVIELNRR